MSLLRLLITISIIYIIISNSIRGTFALERKRQATVQAKIPQKIDISIWGFTAPNAIVQANSVRVFAQVSSKQDGYFIINPLSISQEAKEVCISTIDSNRRVGFPLCVKLPDLNKTTEIGPLYLSPTLSFSNKIIWQGQEAIASGVTIPNTEVKISFFEVGKKSIIQNIGNFLTKILYPKALASELPIITTLSDQNGSFSITIPSNRSTNYRLYAKSFVNKSPTAKTNTLSLLIGSAFIYFVVFIFPRLLVSLLFIGASLLIIQKERETHRIKDWLLEVKEKRLKPIVVKIRLRLVRLSYNLRILWQSRRK